jgi:MYXO-CTERM domain-containing protein
MRDGTSQRTGLMAAITAVMILTCAATSARGEVREYTDYDEWRSAVGHFTTIQFTEYPPGTIVTDQYADLGILFTDGNDVILERSYFLNDGFGLWGPGFDDVTVEFDSARTAIAVHYPGIVRFDLYRADELIYTSSIFDDIISNFAGLLTTEPFDAALIYDPTGNGVAIDDLHFGPPIPAPGALGLLGFAALAGRRRRRRFIADGR